VTVPLQVDSKELPGLLLNGQNVEFEKDLLLVVQELKVMHKGGSTDVSLEPRGARKQLLEFPNLSWLGFRGFTGPKISLTIQVIQGKQL
jgi:hypothetical protein